MKLWYLLGDCQPSLFSVSVASISLNQSVSVFEVPSAREKTGEIRLVSFIRLKRIVQQEEDLKQEVKIAGGPPGPSIGAGVTG